MSQKKETRKLEQLSQLEAYELARLNLVSLYETEEGKKFIHHLIYAFSSNKNTYVLFSKNQLFDCLTKSALLPVYDRNRPVEDEHLKELLLEFKDAATSEARKTELSNEINAYVIELVSANPMPRMAVRSELTNKVLGQEELQALRDFVKDQIQAKNKLIKGMMDFAEGKPRKKYKKPVKHYTPKVAKVTLGDDDELRQKLMSALKS